MRTLVILLAVAASSLAQRGAQTYPSNTTEGLRGVSAVSRKVAWASGTHGTYLRTTDGGRTWMAAQVPEAGALDFRAVVAFSEDEAFLMSAGPGDQSRIYHTTDAGRLWQLQFTNENPKGFFDSMVFWDSTHGIVLGDPIADEGGTLRFELLMTRDGQTWAQMPAAGLPPAMEGEGAFAASNTCLAIVESNIWFATGGRVARVFHSGDRGLSWQVFDTPIVHGPESAGIFSIAFRDSDHGVIAGGDYKHPDQDGANLAFTNDGGKTWTLSKMFPHSYYSAVAYDRRRRGAKSRELDDQRAGVRIFIVGSKFVLDLRPRKEPARVSAGILFNALSSYPGGGAVVVGPEGAVGVIR
jgi:photosystem II stability/assembly factor-like uncharacterized protein